MLQWWLHLPMVRFLINPAFEPLTPAFILLKSAMS